VAAAVSANPALHANLARRAKKILNRAATTAAANMHTRVRVPPASASTPPETPTEFVIPSPQAIFLKKIMRSAYHQILTDENRLNGRPASIADGCLFFATAIPASRTVRRSPAPSYGQAT
jgi:hypothetical protein